MNNNPYYVKILILNHERTKMVGFDVYDWIEPIQDQLKLFELPDIGAARTVSGYTGIDVNCEDLHKFAILRSMSSHVTYFYCTVDPNDLGCPTDSEVVGLDDRKLSPESRWMIKNYDKEFYDTIIPSGFQFDV